MQPMRLLLGGLLGLVCLAAPLRAEGPPSPLRLIPPRAPIVLQTRGPRQLLEAVLSIDQVKKLQRLDAVQEALDSTSTRRFRQMVAYFERELGVSWPELLDRLGGGGAALATIRLRENSPMLFVLQGTDERLMRKFAPLAFAVIEQEAARQGSADRAVRGTYHGVETVGIGKDFHAAVVQGALLVSNRAETLKRSLDLALGRARKSLADHPGLAEAAALLPKGPLARLWLNLEPVRKAPGGEALYKTPRDPGITVLLGGYADIISRAPSVCAGLYREPGGLLLTFRFPRGREGMGPERALSCQPDGEPGSRPLLEPKNVLLSASYYWDLSCLWTDRVKIFGEKNAGAFEKADKRSGAVLSNFRLSKLLTQTGPYHRFVAAHQLKAAYTKQPRTLLPAFAYVLEMRKPDEFARAMETILRGTALLGGRRFGLKLSEEKYRGCEIVGYRFNEGREVKQDVNDLRFNFSPCFVRVGNQFVASSTIELCRELVDLLQAEARSRTKGAVPNSRVRLYAVGGAGLVRSYEPQLVTQAILDQAIPIEEARKQVRAFLALLAQGGSLSLEATYRPRQFDYDIRLTFKK